METFMNGGGRQMLQLLVVLLLRIFLKKGKGLFWGKSVCCAGSKIWKGLSFEWLTWQSGISIKWTATLRTHRNSYIDFCRTICLRTTHFICQPLNNLWSTLDNIFCHSYEHASKENKILNAFARCCVERGNEVEQDCVLDGSGMTASTKTLENLLNVWQLDELQNRNHGNTLLYFFSEI